MAESEAEDEVIAFLALFPGLGSCLTKEISK